jgi:glycosyltransferase involved in cell wall biosynthesis
MEAQACSRAVITSNVAGCRDVILENITGFLVETRNAIDLEEKMLEFIKNPNLIHEMGKNAYNHAHKNFSIKRSVDLHFEMFEKALNH